MVGNILNKSSRDTFGLFCVSLPVKDDKPTVNAEDEIS